MCQFTLTILILDRSICSGGPQSADTEATEKERMCMNTELDKPPRQALSQWIRVVTFAIAFAWVEAAVVVYLREIYYEGSFCFPLVVEWKDGKYVADQLIRIEFTREIATIVMLVAVGCAAGKNALQKFCFFMVAFGIWDVFYYVCLWLMISWPESLMTWDILFLVPLPWVGPVITPVLLAFTMLATGSLLIYYNEKGCVIDWRWFDWIIESACVLLIIVAFCWDWKNIIQLPDGLPRSGIPSPFAWWLYLPAYFFSVVYFSVRLKQIVRANKRQPPTID